MLSFLLHIPELHIRATPIGSRLFPALRCNNIADRAFTAWCRAHEGLKMAYRHIIGDAALLATIGLMAAIIGGAF